MRDVHGAAKWLGRVLSKVSWDIGAKMAFFLATGTLRSRSGLDLQQAGGFTVVAEKLNWYRFISHFRSVHRGAFFAELKTTSVRKLLPEAWGECAAVSKSVFVLPVDPSRAKDSFVRYILLMVLLAVC